MKIFILTLSLFVLAACSEYNKVLKSDDYEHKFNVANELYDKGQYDRSIAIYEQIYQRFPKTGQGEVSYYRIGKSYYNEEDYYMAGYYLGSYHTRFPFSPQAEEALFLSAMCNVKVSPEPTLDQNETELAINSLQLFINRYPKSELVDSCNQSIDLLRFKLETKDFKSVELYSKTENYRAAVVAAQTFLKQYPLSSYKEEVMYIEVKNAALLAVNSVESKKEERIEETRKSYRNFASEFPESKYLKELNNVVKKFESSENP